MTTSLRAPALSTATIFIDESGSRASASKFFVMGAIKTRTPGLLARRLQQVRDQTGFGGEFKFAATTRGALSAYYSAIDVLGESDAHIVASVVDRTVFDPFPGATDWQVHADVAAKLLCAAINRNEHVGVVMDIISTPPEVAVEDEVKRQTNRRLRSTSVVSAISADSKSTDLLQMADMVAGAVAHERRRALGESGKTDAHPNSLKAKVAARMLAAFDMTGASDQRNDRANLATLRAPKQRRKTRPDPQTRGLAVVEPIRRSS